MDDALPYPVGFQTEYLERLVRSTVTNLLANANLTKSHAEAIFDALNRGKDLPPGDPLARDRRDILHEAIVAERFPEFFRERVCEVLGLVNATATTQLVERSTKKKLEDWTIEECRNAITEKLHTKIGKKKFCVFDAKKDDEMQKICSRLKKMLGPRRDPGLYVQIDKSTNRYKVFAYCMDTPLKPNASKCSKSRRDTGCLGCGGTCIVNVLRQNGFTELL